MSGQVCFESNETDHFSRCSGEFHCSFEEEPICMFTQDKNDNFDWTRHSAATRDTKYTPNTGPSGDRSGSKQGLYDHRTWERFTSQYMCSKHQLGSY